MDPCQYAGTGCDGTSRYPLLGVLLSLNCSALVFTVIQYFRSSYKSTSRTVLPSVIVSELFLIGTTLSRFFEEKHSFVTSLLLIASISALFFITLMLVVWILLRPVVFMKVELSWQYKATRILYVTWTLGTLALLIASNVELSLGRINQYQDQISVFFACFGITILLFSVMLAWSARYLFFAMRRVNRQYDRFTKHSAYQRKNLIRNARKLSKLIAFVCVLTSGIAFALCGAYLALGVTGLTSSILWFFLITGLTVLQIVLSMFFGNRAYCVWRNGGSATASATASSNLQKFRSSRAEDVIYNYTKKGDPAEGHYLENAVAKRNVDPLPDLVHGQESIYDKVGGREMVDKVVLIFYEKMLADPRVSSFFGDYSMTLLRKKQEMFIILMMGGPAVYTGRSLRQAHAKLNLDAESFDIAAQHMRDAMLEAGMAVADVDVVIARVGMFKSEILGLAGICEVPVTDEQEQAVANV